MPFKDKEARIKHDREYYQKNKEKINQKARERYKNNEVIYQKKQEYRRQNSQKNIEYAKKYNKENKEKIRLKRSIYHQREETKKITRISQWKSRGIIDSDFSSLYDVYKKETNCYICGNEFKDSKDRHLDHDHETGEVRFICCRVCNSHFLKEKYNIWK